jgi:UDP-N-acetylmuramate dehydrogenase
MEIHENASLASHSTMRLGGNARYLAETFSKSDVKELFDWAKTKNLNVKMIGHGSNIVWRDEGFDGLIIVNKIMGRDVLSEDKDSVILQIGGGEVWDEVVRRTVDNGWSGIEFLSLIPGTCGAAPVQNIGAYGAELSNTLLSVEVFDTQDEIFKKIAAKDCDFSYRNSRFKSYDKGRYMIISIKIKLSKSNSMPPFYEALNKYFEDNNINEYSPENIREAVIAIRQSKLPDPAIVANNGSFFTNPYVTNEDFEVLKQRFPAIKGWPTNDGKIKLAAGWLVESAGFKGVHDKETGMATWERQALVLVNENAKNTADLLIFRQKITDKVKQMFGITLEQEPELLP